MCAFLLVVVVIVLENRQFQRQMVNLSSDFLATVRAELRCPNELQRCPNQTPPNIIIALLLIGDLSGSRETI